MLSRIRPIVLALCAAALWGAAVCAQASHQNPRKGAPPSAETRPTLALQTGHSGWVECIAFSPDGRLAATGSEDKTARLWNVRTGEMLATLPGHTDFVEAVLFSPDGRMLATHGIGDAALRLWDARRGRLLATLPAGGMLVMAFSPDGGRLAAAGYDSRVHLWNLRTFQPAGGFSGSGMWSAASLAFSPDGALLAAGGDDGTNFDPSQPAGMG
jgi:WD40 repeat protein